MAVLLAGLPVDVPGTTVNRLCGSGLEAVGTRGAGDQGAARRMRDRRRRREHDARALRHAARRTRRSRAAPPIYDTTIGWRFVNPLMKEPYGVDSMPETGENVAEEYQIAPRGPGRVRAAAASSARGGARERASSTARSCR